MRVKARARASSTPSSSWIGGDATDPAGPSEARKQPHVQRPRGPAWQIGRRCCGRIGSGAGDGPSGSHGGRQQVGPRTARRSTTEKTLIGAEKWPFHPGGKRWRGQEALTTPVRAPRRAAHVRKVARSAAPSSHKQFSVPGMHAT